MSSYECARCGRTIREVGTLHCVTPTLRKGRQYACEDCMTAEELQRVPEFNRELHGLLNGVGGDAE